MVNMAYASPEIARARTLPEIFNARAALTPKLLAYREYDARRQSWHYGDACIFPDLFRRRSSLQEPDGAIGRFAVSDLPPHVT